VVTIISHDLFLHHEVQLMEQRVPGLPGKFCARRSETKWHSKGPGKGLGAVHGMGAGRVHGA
jgi:hypothetical protein